MGSGQGTTQEPIQTTTQELIQTTTQETTQRTTVKPEICSLCFSRYQRSQPSVCICTHCSLPLCSECLDDHINELPQNVAQLSRQLHELEQLLQSKQNMVQQEVSKSTDEIKQCIKNYQSDLLEAHHAIIDGIGNAKQDANKYLEKIHSELQTIKVDIETLTKEPVFQPIRMEALLNQLNQIREQLETYEIIKDTELQITVPKYIIKFQCIPISTTDTIELPESESMNREDNAGRKSSRRNNSHPYKNTSSNFRKKNRSS